MSNNNPKLYQLANILAVVAVIAMNGISEAIPLNGVTAGEVSDSLPSAFTPAGYTFAVWGLIYAALAGFAIYQALPAQRERPFLARLAWLVPISSAFNIAWLIAWHYRSFPLSLLFIVGLLITLISIYQRLQIGRPNPGLTTADKLLYQAPFSLYLGWVSVATIANFSSVLNSVYNWQGFGIADATWSAIMMGVATILSALLLLNRRNLSFAGVLIWALFGIRAAYMDVPLIANAALIASITILILALLGYWRTRELAPPVPILSTAA
jgi:hypothetical protein